MSWMSLPTTMIFRRIKCYLFSDPDKRIRTVSHAHSLYSLERQTSRGKDMPKQYVLSQA